MPTADHYRRLLEAYLLGARSHLDFWRETPEENPQAAYDRVGPYYLTYASKADYAGPKDGAGIPLLDYRGKVGLQHNPIAIAQYGLAHFNRSRQAPASLQTFLGTARWLMSHLETNREGVPVWQHHFRWPYRRGLEPPWPSALAQGQALSVLVRAASETGDRSYLACAETALKALTLPVSEGGLSVRETGGGVWLEEYPVDPPSHILNGAVCAAWGLFDFWLATSNPRARRLFDETIETMERALPRYDTGFWSLYELPGGGFPPMVASFLYHRLHIVQLKILFRMTGKKPFLEYAQRWERFLRNPFCRARAWVRKAAFKLSRY